MMQEGVDLALEADLNQVRRKSMQLGHLFQQMMEQVFSGDFPLASPPDPEQRGSHISFSHPEAYSIVQVRPACHLPSPAICEFHRPDFSLGIIRALRKVLRKGVRV